jgi:hypothetical protein
MVVPLGMLFSIQPASLPPILALGFPVVFVSMWFGVGAVLAEMSGWPELARRFPGGIRPKGQRLSRQVVKIGSVNENGVTGIVVCAAGLYLDTMFLFRFRRPPVMVPWDSVRYTTERRFLWYRWYEFDLGDITTISVRPAAFEAIMQHQTARMAHPGPNVR